MQLPNWKVLLFAALAVIAGLALLAPAFEKPARSPAVAFSARSPTAVDSMEARRAVGKHVGRYGILGELPERDAFGEKKSDIFGAQSWQLPPAQLAVSASSAPPPPPMVYRFAGRLLQDGKLQLFISKGDKPVPVKIGDTLEGGYVVEAISADTIALIYPPLGYRAYIVIPPIMSAAGSASSTSMVTPPTGLGAVPAQAVTNPPILSTHTQRDMSTAGQPSAGAK